MVSITKSFSLASRDMIRAGIYNERDGTVLLYVDLGDSTVGFLFPVGDLMISVYNYLRFPALR
jgi:hypothetical protein